MFTWDADIPNSISLDTVHYTEASSRLSPYCGLKSSFSDFVLPTLHREGEVTSAGNDDFPVDGEEGPMLANCLLGLAV